MARERRKILVGKVTSDKMEKTVVVQVERLRKHKRYDKVVRLHRRYKAHDEDNAASEGDIVRIIETKPTSKEKRWSVVGIVRRKTI